jgi:hypothetical protein
MWLLLIGNVVVMASKQMGQFSGYLSKPVVARKALSATELRRYEGIDISPSMEEMEDVLGVSRPFFFSG